MATLKSKPPSETEFFTIPAGELLEATVEEVEIREFDWNNPDKGGATEHIVKLRWNFLITDEGEWKGKKIHGETSPTFTNHPNCKAMNWAMALTGRPYPPGEELDTDDLMGLRCRIAIINRQDKKDETKVWHTVVAPIRARQF